MISDRKTIEYFERYTPAYPLERFRYAIEFIKAHAFEESTLVDIGCGLGNIIELVINETPIRNVYGIDVVTNYLEKTRARLNCETLYGSILDREFINNIPMKFDFVLMGAVLHHLVGKTRVQSKHNVELAIENALTLVRKNGWLILVEPAYYPSFPIIVIFYIKRFITKFTSRRVYIFNRWANNIGAPVVSYYTNEELREMLKINNTCKIVQQKMEEEKINLMRRLGGIRRKTDTTIISQKFLKHR